jgi:Helix-turn-helix domain
MPAPTGGAASVRGHPVSGRRYLSVAEFAELKGIPAATVRKQCERGALHCRKTKSRWRIWVGGTDRQPRR